MNTTMQRLLCCALSLGSLCLCARPLKAGAADAEPARVVAEAVEPDSAWLVGVWDGWGVTCGRVRRSDGEPVAVMGALSTQTPVGRPVQLQGRYVQNSPCQETQQVFLVTVQP